MLDRIGPTKRPVEKCRGRQRWRSLLFLHWAVPVDVLRPLVPESLDLDLYDGKAYVGVVPFAMKGVRPNWCPAALAFNFLETNVRTYVSRGDLPGVYFFSLEAASRIAVWIARQVWGLPYFFAEMQSTRDGDEVHYRSRRRGSGVAHEVRYRIGPALDPAAPESLEFFFLERYLLFVTSGDRTWAGQVYHTPYPAHSAEVLEVHDELLQAAGFDTPGRPPDYAHYSPGVDVEIFPLRPV